VVRTGVDGAVARVIKHAGDDPDNTDRAVIVAEVKPNGTGENRFMAGTGVGIVTQPGIRIPVGEPAINPVPRQMMLQAIEEVLEEATNPGFDLIIGCENGEEVAKRTFNERLGIIGGISILGTSGIVEPMSLASYKASIEVYIRVALGTSASCIAFMPGNIGLSYAKRHLQLAKQRIVVIANFLGFALDFADEYLKEQDRVLDQLMVLGHPGKLAKVLEDVWDTHSSKSDMAMDVVADVAKSMGADPDITKVLRSCKTVEGAVDFLKDEPLGRHIWKTIEDRGSALMHNRVHRVGQIQLRLFAMNGQPLGHAAEEAW
jgi:cobalt-precorrin-5B (C1)-methyltransferase